MKQHEIDFLIKELKQKTESQQSPDKTDKHSDKLKRKKQKLLPLGIFR